MLFSIDRFMGKYALLVDDDGGIRTVPRALLPDVGEGDVVRYDGDTYVYDEEETAARRAYVLRLQERLFGRS